MKPALSVVLLAALAAPTIAPVEVGPISLQELVRSSTVIVLGQVGSVSESADHQRVATIVPTETWRGEARPRITFNATSTWECDISTARVGERVVIFLVPDQLGTLRIAHAGRGRMPLRYSDGKAYATYFSSIEFETDPAHRIDFRNWDPYRYGVEVSELKRLVGEALREIDQPAQAQRVK